MTPEQLIALPQTAPPKLRKQVSKLAAALWIRCVAPSSEYSWRSDTARRSDPVVRWEWLLPRVWVQWGGVDVWLTEYSYDVNYVPPCPSQWASLFNPEMAADHVKNGLCYARSL